NSKMFKIASLVACAVAVLSLVNVTSARVPLPQWCLCGDNGKSRLVCEMNFGAWDGHTCRLDNQNSLKHPRKKLPIVGGRLVPNGIRAIKVLVILNANQTTISVRLEGYI
ncbi:hypothetical protein BGZ91_004883, partial [Linnemannia elongata]